MNPVIIEDGFSESLRDIEQPYEEKSTLNIFSLVATCLDELSDNEKKTVAQTLETIVMMKEEIVILDSVDENSDIIGMKKEELREQIVLLFEELEIEQDEEDIENFLDMLFLLKFEPLQEKEAMETGDDFNREDLHIAKHSFIFITAAVAGIEHSIENLIGRIALVSTGNYHFQKQFVS